MRIGEATFIEPSSAQSVQRANDVERAVLECEVGQWLPVELDRPGQATGLVTKIKERGYTVRRSRLTVFVKAPDTARPHTHRWVIPPGVTDATSVDSKCACGEIKRAIEVSANGTTKDAVGQPHG